MNPLTVKEKHIFNNFLNDTKFDLTPLLCIPDIFFNCVSLDMHDFKQSDYYTAYIFFSINLMYLSSIVLSSILRYYMQSKTNKTNKQTNKYIYIYLHVCACVYLRVKKVILSKSCPNPKQRGFHLWKRFPVVRDHPASHFFLFMLKRLGEFLSCWTDIDILPKGYRHSCWCISLSFFKHASISGLPSPSLTLLF